MTNSQWYTPIEKLKPFVYKISTPQVGGTGFQMMYSKSKKFCGIATAYHVIAHAHEWEEPIKITHFNSQKTLILKTPDRVIIPYPDKDLAFILFPKNDLPVNQDVPEIVPPQKTLKQGVEIGWCGFPAIAPNESCFFAGYISCCLDNQYSYLVDGVAINGVSGGPAFFKSDSGEPVICGVVTAYIPNRATGEVLPGVCVVTSIEPYQNMLAGLKNLEDAGKKAEEVKKQTLSAVVPPIDNKKKEIGK